MFSSEDLELPEGLEPAEDDESAVDGDAAPVKKTAKTAKAAKPEGSDALASLKKDLEGKLGLKLNWGSDPAFVPEKVPLNIAALDQALGGGFAMGKITLLVGEESAGKTLLAMTAIKAGQAKGMPVVFLDVERSFTDDWARAVGIDPDKIILSLPETGEAAFDVAFAVVQSKPGGILVIDSLAAMPPAAEMEASSEQQFMGTQARMINRGIRTLNAKNTGGWMILIVNQIREKVGVVYGNPETLPGGKGQRYYAWQIVRVRRGANLEEGVGKAKRLVGRMLRIKLDKNKQSPPGAEAEVPFYFTGDFDTVSGLLDTAIELGIIVQSGGHYAFGEQKWHGRRALREHFDDEDEQQRLTDAISALGTVDDGFEDEE